MREHSEKWLLPSSTKVKVLLIIPWVDATPRRKAYGTTSCDNTTVFQRTIKLKAISNNINKKTVLRQQAHECDDRYLFLRLIYVIKSFHPINNSKQEESKKEMSHNKHIL